MNIDTTEVKKFSNIANKWWDKNGPCGPLHVLNTARTKYILQNSDINNKNILDIGCGAGILTETLAKNGAITTGIDASSELINTAKNHAQFNNLNINYIHTTAEEYAINNFDKFDIITCMELLEHVPDPNKLISACNKLLKPNGILFLSTINRTPKAYLLAIVAAEYIFKIIEKNTHDYNKLIKPSELKHDLENNNFVLEDLTGIKYDPILKKSSLISNVDINYLAYAIKN